MFDFRRVTVFYLVHGFSKHKMTGYAENLAEHEALDSLATSVNMHTKKMFVSNIKPQFCESNNCSLWG